MSRQRFSIVVASSVWKPDVAVRFPVVMIDSNCPDEKGTKKSQIQGRIRSTRRRGAFGLPFSFWILLASIPSAETWPRSLAGLSCPLQHPDFLGPARAGCAARADPERVPSHRYADR